MSRTGRSVSLCATITGMEIPVSGGVPAQCKQFAYSKPITYFKWLFHTISSVSDIAVGKAPRNNSPRSNCISLKISRFKG